MRAGRWEGSHPNNRPARSKKKCPTKPVVDGAVQFRGGKSGHSRPALASQHPRSWFRINDNWPGKEQYSIRPGPVWRSPREGPRTSDEHHARHAARNSIFGFRRGIDGCRICSTSHSGSEQLHNPAGMPGRVSFCANPVKSVSMTNSRASASATGVPRRTSSVVVLPH